MLLAAWGRRRIGAAGHTSSPCSLCSGTNHVAVVVFVTSSSSSSSSCGRVWNQYRRRRRRWRRGVHDPGHHRVAGRHRCRVAGRGRRFPSPYVAAGHAPCSRCRRRAAACPTPLILLLVQCGRGGSHAWFVLFSFLLSCLLCCRCRCLGRRGCDQCIRLFLLGCLTRLPPLWRRQQWQRGWGWWSPRQWSDTLGR